ncbi:MAG: hypothetical protein KC766_25535, partial [Myxococcales bacterium]|nr:hypothetical protein [Myxococcales bacterium]
RSSIPFEVAYTMTPDGKLARLPGLPRVPFEAGRFAIRLKPGEAAPSGGQVLTGRDGERVGTIYWPGAP